MDAFAQGKIDSNLPLGGLAQGMLGEDWRNVLAHRPNEFTMDRYGRVYDSSLGIDPSAFTNITGQLLVRKVIEGYQNPAFIGDQLVEEMEETMPAAILGELKVPGISNVIDEPRLVRPNEPYPQTSVVEDWFTLPGIGRYGQIVPITIEALAQDRTGKLQDTMTKLGFRCGLRREKEILKVVMGLTNNYKWKDTTYNTYQTTGSWVNYRTGVDVTAGTFGLNDFFKQQALFNKINDPYINEPIDIDVGQMQVLHMPDAALSFNAAINATTVRTGQVNTNPVLSTEGPNPLTPPQGFLQSKYAYKMLLDAGVSPSDAVHYWFMGQFKRAFVYRSWIQPTFKAAPPGNEAEFNREVAILIKAIEAGAGGVKDPRYTSKSKNL
jgi:hypothetical protein